MRTKVIIPFLLIAVLFSSCVYNYYDDQASVIKSNWKITIPAEDKELYFGMLSSFLGDGPRYTVLEYEDDTKLVNLFDWKEPEKKDVSEALGIIEELNDGLEYNDRSDEKVPKKLIPDFSKLPMWKTAKDEGYDFIYIFYDDDRSRLYIVENLL